MLLSRASLITIAAAFLVFTILLSAAGPMRDTTKVSLDRAEIESMDRRLISDIGLANVDVQLDGKQGDFYRFVLTSVDGGGIYLIAKLRADSNFDVLWRGQDTPPCNVADGRGIPVTLVPFCFETVSVNRASWFDRLLLRVLD